MKRLLVRLSAALTVAFFMLESSLYTYAAFEMPKNMSKSFEKLFDRLFKDSFNKYFEKLNAENTVRAKTGILVALFAIVAAIIFIAIFSIDNVG